MMRLTIPTPIIRTEAEGPVGPPAQGRQAITTYQIQPSPMRLAASRTRTTQARVAAPCIQRAIVRSRSSQSICRSGHDGNACGGRFRFMESNFEVGLEAG